MTRVNKIVVIVGKRGSGKSHYYKNTLEPIIYKNFPKLLVYDTLDHPAYRDVPFLEQSKAKGWTNGKTRMVSTDYMASLEWITENIRDTLLVLEDCGKYLKGNMPRVIEKFLMDTKQINCDVVMFFHSLNRVPGDLFDLADYVVVFKTQNNRFKQSVPDHLIEAAKSVNLSKNPYAYREESVG